MNDGLGIGLFRIANLARLYHAGTATPEQREEFVVHRARALNLLVTTGLPGLSPLVRCGLGLPGCLGMISPAAATLDHATPRSKHGTGVPTNLTPACRPCNSSKGDDLLAHPFSAMFAPLAPPPPSAPFGGLAALLDGASPPRRSPLPRGLSRLLQDEPGRP